jgi:hypothetical protein
MTFRNRFTREHIRRAHQPTPFPPEPGGPFVMLS